MDRLGERTQQGPELAPELRQGLLLRVGAGLHLLLQLLGPGEEVRPSLIGRSQERLACELSPTQPDLLEPLVDLMAQVGIHGIDEPARIAALRVLDRPDQPRTIPAEGLRQPGDEPLKVRLRLVEVARDPPAQQPVNRLGEYCLQHLRRGLDDRLPVLIHPLPNPVHIPLILGQALADLSVALLGLGLGALDHLGGLRVEDQAVPAHLASGLGLVDQPLHCLLAWTEPSHQVILKREDEPRGAGVALATGPASQLVVDALGLVPLRADHVQPAERLGSQAERDVRPPAGHVRRNRHRAEQSCLRGDGFLLVVALNPLGVEHLKHLGRNARCRQQVPEPLRLLDGRGRHQDRTSRRMGLHHLLDERRELLIFGDIDLIGQVLPAQLAAEGNLHHPQAVALEELLRTRGGRAGGAGQLGVEHVVALRGNRGQRPVFRLDRNGGMAVGFLLGFDGLVQPPGPTPALRFLSGELIHDDHLVILNEVVDVLLKEMVRAQCLVDEEEPADTLSLEILVGGELAVLLEQPLDLMQARVGKLHRSVLFRDQDVLLKLQHPRNGIGGFVALDIGALPGNDRRSARLVDEQPVRLVRDHGPRLTPHLPILAVDQVAPEVVELELLIRAVGDLCLIRLFALVAARWLRHQPDRQAQRFVQRPHVVVVPSGQGVIRRAHVHPFTEQRVEVRHQRRGERLAFPGDLFGDEALLHDDGRKELHVIVPVQAGLVFAEAPGHLSRHGERARQDPPQRPLLGPFLDGL